MADTNSINVYDPANDPGHFWEDVQNVLCAVFGESHFNRTYFQWKYLSNPFGPSILVYAREDNRPDSPIIAFRSFWKWEFYCNGDIMTAAQPCDTAVLPDFRRRGLFRRLTNEALKVAQSRNIGLLFNNPNPEARLEYLKLGWESTQGMRWFAKFINVGKVMAAICRCRGRMPQANWTRPLKPVEQMDFPIADRNGIYEWFSEDTIITRKDSAFLAWRYLKAPHREYRIITPGIQGIAGGYLIYGTANRASLREVQIIDIMLKPRDISCLKEMLNQVIAQERPDWLTYAASPSHPCNSLIRDCSFHPLPRKISIVVRNMMELDDAVPAGWQKKFALTLGDLDTF